MSFPYGGFTTMLNPMQILAFAPWQDDIGAVKVYVRFIAESGHVQRTRPCLLWAKSRHQVSRR
jgi:hypothetical protein